MVIDFQSYELRDIVPPEVKDARVLDAETGEDLGARLPIFYADDEAGVYRYYRKDADGQFLLDETGEDLLFEERHGPIRIVPGSALA